MSEMRSPTGPTTPNKPSPALVPWIFWGAMLFSTLLFAGLMDNVIRQKTETPVEIFEAFQNPMFVPLAMIAASSLFISYFLPSIILKGRVRQSLNSSASQAADLNDTKVFEIYFPSFIVQLALRESVAVMGFLLGTMTNSSQAGLLFVALGAIGIATNRPNLALWRARIVAAAS